MKWQISDGVSAMAYYVRYIASVIINICGGNGWRQSKVLAGVKSVEQWHDGGSVMVCQ